MSIFDLFSMAIKNLFKRKLRTFLTSLGVIVGSTSIVIMVSLGLGINKSFEESISGMGDITTITVHDPDSNMGRYNESSGDVSFNSNAKLDEKTLEKMRKISGVKGATPILSVDLNLFSGKYRGWGNIVGITQEGMDLFEFNLQEGRTLQPGDKWGAVAGTQVGAQFYDPNQRNIMMNWDDQIVNVMEDKIEATYDWNYGQVDFFDDGSQESKPTTKPYSLNVVGKLAESDWERDTSIYMEISEVKKMKRDQQKFEQESEYGSGGSKPSSNEYDVIWVKCAEMNVVEQIASEIKAMGFYANTPFTYLEEMKEMSGTLQVFLGIMGMVTLFVSALGIANTMITSTYERTREIGIMKVIGATIKDIKRLFLLESALIGFVGGGFGVALSYVASYFMNVSEIDIFGTGAAASSVIPPWLAVYTLLFSAVIGLVSGYLPAVRATKLSALEAIKSE